MHQKLTFNFMCCSVLVGGSNTQIIIGVVIAAVFVLAITVVAVIYWKIKGNFTKYSYYSLFLRYLFFFSTYPHIY